jgi:hypothetical protein
MEINRQMHGLVLKVQLVEQESLQQKEMIETQASQITQWRNQVRNNE